MSRGRRRNALLLLCGAGIEAGFLYLVWIGDLRNQVPLFWSGVFPVFLLYLLAAALVLRVPGRPVRPILLCALVFRLTFWWSPPTLSDDIHRYIWDGRVQLAGVNPYRYPPEAGELAHLRDALYAGINHKQIPTVYPPLAQFFFRAVCALRPDPGLMKFDLLLCEFGLVLVLVGALRQRGQDPGRVLLYAWNPLPVVEVAGSGHVDALGVLLLLLALYLLAGKRRTLASAALAGAFLSKLVPALLLPIFWVRMAPAREQNFWKRWLDVRPRLPLLWFPLLAGLGFWVFGDAGLRIFAGLRTYLLHWRFNDAAFSLLHLFWSPLHEHGDPQLWARWTSVALLLLIALWAARRGTDPYRAAFWALGAQVLLSPTLHPWYLLWVLPFLPFFAAPAWMLLSGLAFLAYEVLIEYSKTGIWTEQTWVKWAEFGPFYALLIAYPLYQRYRRVRGPQSSDN